MTSYIYFTFIISMLDRQAKKPVIRDGAFGNLSRMQERLAADAATPATGKPLDQPGEARI